MIIQDNDGAIMGSPIAYDNETEPAPPPSEPAQKYMKFNEIDYHDTSECPLCEINSVNKVRVNEKLVTAINQCSENYKLTHDVKYLKMVKMIHNDKIKIPTDRIIESGKCPGNKTHYSMVNLNDVLQHVNTFSIESELLNIFKFLNKRQANLREMIVKDDGSINQECNRVVAEDIDRMLKIATVIKKKRKMNKL